MNFVGQAKRLLRFVGPFPYNPTLVFLFFFSHYLSRLLPAIASEAAGPARVRAVLAALLICLVSSGAYAVTSDLLKRYRRWSSSNFVLYYLELQGILVVGVVAHWLILSALAPFGFNFVIEFDFINSPNLLPWTSLLMLLVFALMHYAERNVLERLANANALNQQLQKARLEMLLVEEDLRKQTAALLHDRVQSQITIAAMNLAKVQLQVSPDSSAEIAEIRAHLEKIRRIDLKNVSQSLSPNIEALGLKQSVQEFTNEIDSKIHFLVEIDDTAFENNERLALGIFRIIEQAVVNCITHGPARNVRIMAQPAAAEGIDLVVEDDGPGVDPTAAGQGVGTAVIDSWVSILKGTKSVESSPGNGYKLRVLAPL